jgi:hypothetical protein
MKLLAHRGFWKEASEKNTRAAFVRAFDLGYGIETDLRDQGGRIVIAHDLPTGENLIIFDDLLKLYVDKGKPGTLALNIKSDGLQKEIKRSLAQHDVADYFVFDMSVPDALGYLKEGVTAFTRHSEYETAPSFYEESAGVWIDCFKSDWITNAVIAPHIAAGKVVALVSPELHKRPHRKVWKHLADADHSEVLLCTDFPDEADSFFNYAKALA